MYAVVGSMRSVSLANISPASFKTLLLPFVNSHPEDEIDFLRKQKYISNDSSVQEVKLKRVDIILSILNIIILILSIAEVSFDFLHK